MSELLENNRFSVTTVGAFGLRADNGRDLTPPGNLPRALILILALSDGHRVMRRHVESLLWPEKDGIKAAGSLRGMLKKLRDSLDQAIDGDRTDIWLEPSRFSIDLIEDRHAALAAIADGRVLAEGLAVNSEPFEDWLRLEQSSLEKDAEQQDDSDILIPDSGRNRSTLRNTAPVLLTDIRNFGNGIADFVAEGVRSQLGQTMSDHLRMDTIPLNDGTGQIVRTPGACCRIFVREMGARFVMLARVTEEPSGRQIWNRRVEVNAHDDLEAADVASAMAFEISEVVANCRFEASDTVRANAMAVAALSDVFSFDPGRILEADQTLALANEIDPHAPRLALRALAKGFLAVERTINDMQGLRDEVEPLVEQALALDANNPLAMAFIADVQDLVFEDPLMALSYAERALQINPGTGYAHASLGALELRRGRTQAAMTSASKARRQLSFTSMQVFSLTRYCTAAISHGEFENAMDAAEQATILAPLSRPPLRHLYALKLHAGDEAGASHALTRLRQLEPDFSMQRIREDPSFPAATIRSAGLDRLPDVEHDDSARADVPDDESEDS